MSNWDTGLQVFDRFSTIWVMFSTGFLLGITGCDTTLDYCGLKERLFGWDNVPYPRCVGIKNPSATASHTGVVICGRCVFGITGIKGYRLPGQGATPPAQARSQRFTAIGIITHTKSSRFSGRTTPGLAGPLLSKTTRSSLITFSTSIK